jgi:3-isopropylmalate/(R)-2-methylmalate dehydratase large subunit
MPFTLAQKLLARHARDITSEAELSPGRIVNCAVSMVLANDITAPLAIDSFYSMGAKKVFDPSKIVLVMDHFTPQKDIAAAEQILISRAFAAQQGITHYYEGGAAGVEHALLPELGIVGPGDLIIGADSHTCTYGGLGAFATGMGSTDVAAAMALGENWFKVPQSVKVEFDGNLPPNVSGKDLILWLIGKIGVDGARYMALEFCGPTIDALSVEGRMTMANMAIEAGAKVGLFVADDVTLAYAKAANHKNSATLAPDKDAAYTSHIKCNVSSLEPQVACPHIPENVKPISRVEKKPVHQVIIGSCTNGRIEDMRAAAKIFKGRKTHKNVRCIILPATPGIWKQALREGLIEIFLDANCIMGPPSCGPCLGGHLGILGSGEVAVSTTNRNFKGRMGALSSEIFLVNPAVAAASAIAGELMDPGKM